MRAIQLQLPNPRHTEIHRIFVNAKPDNAWEIARHFDMSMVPWVRLLFDIRTLPSKIVGSDNQNIDRRLGIDQITQEETGFMIIHETEREVVVGAVGQFWHLDIPFAKVKPDKFRTFNTPGWGKVAWAITVEPYLDGSTIRFELRTSATDDQSWTKLNRYYHIIGVGSRLIRESLLAHIQADLGKMKLPDDNHRPLPGDELIPDSQYSITFHTNIEAPPPIVWRYLMQLGCDRAGWYSIDWLDHAGIPSVNHLVTGWETRNIGDKLAATPAQDSFFEVYSIKHEKYFIIGGKTVRAGGPFKMTWAFILEPIGEDATHLISRARMESSPKWAEWLMGNVLYPPVHGLMSVSQLKNIRHLAERDAQARLSS
ncbi:SRPBCC family protein [Solitalea koreensis]|uniref:Polyketide cyclase / dehydrase and lipid transport n=1 Tax=Solitalea koreensis TaxID=543615 RepID=A0A521D2Y0_9SPHI|nr:SRPBCC family protein [Solitalea koreensis]SMO66007.1 hypothetical protein SAMN06265350_105222 [Solitalea koreensis]